jgi:DNA-binding transcriptional LysR family regulator
LGLSASAMSTTLARLRAATGDPLLVRAGRGLVPTPHASELRERVRARAQDAQTVLRPAVASLDLANLKRSFAIRSKEGFVEVSAAQLIAAVTATAPNVPFVSRPSPTRRASAVRGLVDLEIGVLGKSDPEVCLQTLFRDHFFCAVREGYSLLARGKVTPERYTASGHVVASRRGHSSGARRSSGGPWSLAQVVVVVRSFRAALAVAIVSDLVALVTGSFFNATQGNKIMSGPAVVRSFPLPVRTQAITVSQVWYPRLDADPAHRWLRGFGAGNLR